ncbi:MAG: Scr1 family TA system antitoxin-like transcriptional regulator [Streptosporangiaceae bacterium]
MAHSPRHRHVASGARLGGHRYGPVSGVLGEATLRQRVGAAGVMRGQLKRLLHDAERPKVTLQVPGRLDHG